MSEIVAQIAQEIAKSHPQLIVEAGYPAPPFFYIGSGETNEKYTLRYVSESRSFDGYSDRHAQGNLEHLGSNPENAILKALSLTDKRIYFQPFELSQGCKRPNMPLLAPEKTKLSFGKHRDKLISEVAQNDPGYIEYMLSIGAPFTPSQQAAIDHYMSEYLAKREAEREELKKKQGTKEYWLEQEIPFGKYRGRKVCEIVLEDMPYLLWMVAQDLDPEVKAGITMCVMQKADMSKVDIAGVIESAQIKVHHDTVSNETTVEGETFRISAIMKALGGSWQSLPKHYTFNYPALNAIVEQLVDLETLNTADPIRLDLATAGLRHKARINRMKIESLPITAKLSREEKMALVSEDTKALMSLGLKFGIAQEVIDDQIEDVGAAIAGYQAGVPLFLNASQAGSGKTFFFAGLVRELKQLDDTLKFVYITKSKQLVKQIIKDTAAYEIEDAIEFKTYAEVGRNGFSPELNSICLVDECHTAKNVESNTGREIYSMASHCKYRVYASATPYESIVETEYLFLDGLFGQFEYKEVAEAYGALFLVESLPNGYGGSRTKVTPKFDTIEDAKQSAIAFNRFLIERGMFVQRKTKLPSELTSSAFIKVEASDEWRDIYQRVKGIYDYAIENSDMYNAYPARINQLKTNTLRRILEASKLEAAIPMIKQSFEDGIQVALFTETKSDGKIGHYRPFEELLAEYNEWRSFPPELREYPAPVSSIELTMAYAFEKHNFKFIIPSAIDVLNKEFGDKFGFYVGAKEFETVTVTEASAKNDKNAWEKREKMGLICTMAKGGTGLSLHPTRKNNPRRQIGINLPWKGYLVEQVSARLARYGMASKVSIDWLFSDIPEDRHLAGVIATRMQLMGATVSGEVSKMSTDLKGYLADFD